MSKSTKGLFSTRLPLAEIYKDSNDEQSLKFSPRFVQY